MKHCETLHQPCPNKPECQGCEALEQRNSDGSYDGIEMAATWRDYIGLVHIAAALLAVVFAGWASQFVPVVAAWVRGLI